MKKILLTIIFASSILCTISCVQKKVNSDSNKNTSREVAEENVEPVHKKMFKFYESCTNGLADTTYRGFIKMWKNSYQSALAFENLPLFIENSKDHAKALLNSIDPRAIWKKARSANNQQHAYFNCSLLTGLLSGSIATRVSSNISSKLPKNFDISAYNRAAQINKNAQLLRSDLEHSLTQHFKLSEKQTHRILNRVRILPKSDSGFDVNYSLQRYPAIVIRPEIEGVRSVEFGLDTTQPINVLFQKNSKSFEDIAHKIEEQSLVNKGIHFSTEVNGNPASIYASSERRLTAAQQIDIVLDLIEY